MTRPALPMTRTAEVAVAAVGSTCTVLPVLRSEEAAICDLVGKRLHKRGGACFFFLQGGIELQVTKLMVRRTAHEE